LSAVFRGVIVTEMKNDDSKLSFVIGSVSTVENAKSEDSRNNEISASMASMFSRGMEIFDDAIIGLTKDYRISVWSIGAEEKFGYSKSEITGKSVKILVPDDRLKEIEDEANTLLAGNIVKGYETVRLHKSGKPIDVSISAAPVYGSDGTINEVVAIYKDVSEKKEVSKKLNEYEKKCMIALEGGQFGVWDLDIEKKKLFHFNSWEKTLGYKENELDVNTA